MSIAGKRAEFGDSRNSFSAITFRKVLKGFEIGGLPYTEVQFQLKRLLATGVSPSELREVLRRSQLIEPLPEYAYLDVLGVLDEAIEQDATMQSDPDDAIEPEEALDSAALAAELQAARDALESERTRVRDAEEALSERIVAEEAVRSRLDIAMREAERYHAELRAARNSIANRDKVTAQMRQTLDERDAELAATRDEHAELAAAQDSELQALRAQAAATAAELGASRDAFEKERRKSQEVERSLSNSNSLGGSAREALASRDKALAEIRQTMTDRDAQIAALKHEHAEALAEIRQTRTERDAQLAALQREHAQTLASLESRSKSAAQLQSNLQASEEKLQTAQRRADELRRELKASHDAIASGNTQVASLQAKLRDDNALIEKLGASVRSEAKRATQWQAAAQLRESVPAEILPSLEAEPPVESLPRVQVQPRVQVAQALSALPKFSWKVRGWRWNFPTPPRAVWIGAAIVLLATAIWLGVHRPSPAPSKPIAAAAAVIQAGTTIRDCPTCPVLTVLPTGRFEQGSAPTENGSAFEKPLHWVMIAHPIALSTNAVTVDEFREFVAATGRDMQGCDTYDGDWRHRAENNWESPGFVQTGSHPVTCTSWNDAKAYASWLSAKTGQHYRLPSASEWEYAARAGGTAAQPWGAEASGACANANVADQSAAHRYPGWAVFACNDGFVQTAPVGSFKANSFGLNDMLGNVFQWTEDCWNADYKGAPIDGSARMDGDCAERELRGGSWFSTPAFVRADYRNHFGVDYRTSSVGIRLARDIAP
ncbi:MAG: SUMF1/EgtB/PvdO family nonheme iron enzyme [Steroidobacteraceae bacterium]